MSTTSLPVFRASCTTSWAWPSSRRPRWIKSSTTLCAVMVLERRDKWAQRACYRSGLARIGHGGLDDFVGRSHAGEHLADAVFTEGAHAELTGAAAKHRGG